MFQHIELYLNFMLLSEEVVEEKPPRQLPIMTERELERVHEICTPKQAWLETLTDEEKVGIVNLHPDIFAVYPRLSFNYL